MGSVKAVGQLRNNKGCGDSEGATKTVNESEEQWRLQV